MRRKINSAVILGLVPRICQPDGRQAQPCNCSLETQQILGTSPRMPALEWVRRLTRFICGLIGVRLADDPCPLPRPTSPPLKKIQKNLSPLHFPRLIIPGRMQPGPGFAPQRHRPAEHFAPHRGGAVFAGRCLRAARLKTWTD